VYLKLLIHINIFVSNHNSNLFDNIKVFDTVKFRGLDYPWDWQKWS